MLLEVKAETHLECVNQRLAGLKRLSVVVHNNVKVRAGQRLWMSRISPYNLHARLFQCFILVVWSFLGLFGLQQASAVKAPITSLDCNFIASPSARSSPPLLHR